MASAHTEAAIWAEGTPYTADDLLRGYNDWISNPKNTESFEWYCENFLGIHNTQENSDGMAGV